MDRKKLTDKIEAAQQGVRRAQVTLMQVESRLRDVDRKIAAQQKMILGHCVLRASADHPDRVGELRALLLQYVVRDADRAALAGTEFQIQHE